MKMERNMQYPYDITKECLKETLQMKRKRKKRKKEKI